MNLTKKWFAYELFDPKEGQAGVPYRGCDVYKAAEVDAKIERLRAALQRIAGGHEATVDCDGCESTKNEARAALGLGHEP